MNGISIGAVGAAIIAGLISILGLVIGKEQKVSEFRQAWIDELRKCLIAYLVNINAICDAVRLNAAGRKFDDTLLASYYQKLNEANHGIILRVNDEETEAKELLRSMDEFEELARNDGNLIPENIRSAESKFIRKSKALLKFEWRRVKRGERIFVYTKRVIFASVTGMILILLYQGLSNYGYLNEYFQSSGTTSQEARKKPGTATNE